MVKICPKCRNIMPIAKNKCEKCGYDNLLLICTNCKKILPSNSKKCPMCGDSFSQKNNINPKFGKTNKSKRKIFPILIFVFGLLFIVYSNFPKICGAFGHIWEPATCTNAKICKLCGTLGGPSLGHKWEGGDCTTRQICSVCGIKGEFLHVIKEDTCGEIICEKCSEEVYYKDHEYNSKNVCIYCGDIKEIKYDSVEYNSDPYWDGVIVAQNIVKNNLKSPSSAKFPSGNGSYIVKKSIDGDFIVSGYVDASNSFGSMLRKNWVVMFNMNGTIETGYTLSNVDIAFY